MNHPAAAKTYREQQAGSLRAGDHLLLPDGERSAEIHSVEVETDDFGSPAIILATLTGGGTLRIAAGSSVRIPGPAADDLPSPETAANAAGNTTVVEDAAIADGAGTADGDAQGADAQASDAGTPLSVVGNEAAGEPARTAPAAVVVPPLPSTTPAVVGPSEDYLALIPDPYWKP